MGVLQGTLWMGVLQGTLWLLCKQVMANLFWMSLWEGSDGAAGGGARAARNADGARCGCSGASQVARNHRWSWVLFGPLHMGFAAAAGQPLCKRVLCAIHRPVVHVDVWHAGCPGTASRPTQRADLDAPFALKTLWVALSQLWLDWTPPHPEFYWSHGFRRV